RHTRCYRDWSSDVCSSDLRVDGLPGREVADDDAGVRAVTQRERELRRRTRGHDRIRYRLVVHGQEEQTLLRGRNHEAPVEKAGRSEERRVGKGWRSRRGED